MQTPQSMKLAMLLVVWVVCGCVAVRVCAVICGCVGGVGVLRCVGVWVCVCMCCDVWVCVHVL